MLVREVAPLARDAWRPHLDQEAQEDRAGVSTFHRWLAIVVTAIRIVVIIVVEITAIRIVVIVVVEITAIRIVVIVIVEITAIRIVVIIIVVITAIRIVATIVSSITRLNRFNPVCQSLNVSKVKVDLVYRIIVVVASLGQGIRSRLDLLLP